MSEPTLPRRFGDWIEVHDMSPPTTPTCIRIDRIEALTQVSENDDGAVLIMVGHSDAEDRSWNLSHSYAEIRALLKQGNH